jgi:hypothetical protein
MERRARGNRFGRESSRWSDRARGQIGRRENTDEAIKRQPMNAEKRAALDRNRANEFIDGFRAGSED